ncbi:immunoglobulin domain-containing protein [Cellulomonas fengjieae]|uniref:immunoglobulin domain-containing protein n=1 Tax=Cellulomonas fengjieae TaxID=2819978 RepID=UPI001BCC316B|nr:immunoglobulin domain-containing protein [Cellulomonas fengjieae]QVI65586.1 immunoglobulin domain-containing protein [Cellulomonas fengjieae]
MLPVTRARARKGTTASRLSQGIAALLAAGLTAGLVTIAATPASAAETVTTYSSSGFTIAAGAVSSSPAAVSVTVPAGTGRLLALRLSIVNPPAIIPEQMNYYVISPSGTARFVGCNTQRTTFDDTFSCAGLQGFYGTDPGGVWTLSATDSAPSGQPTSWGGFALELTTELSAPVVTKDPSDTSARAGTPATFSATASGWPTPSVQWQVKDGTEFVDIPGATTSSYSFTTAMANSGSQYRAVFSNSQGPDAYSTHATLTVTPPVPLITNQPQSTTVDSGSLATFYSTADGTPTPTVQWQHAAPGGSFTDISGATSSSYTFTAQAAQDGYRYQAVFINSHGDVTSNPVTLTVRPRGPVVTSNPGNVTVNEGGPATFTAAATGDPEATVQWYVSTDAGVTFTDIAGATSPTYTIASTDRAQHLSQFLAVFTNIAGDAPTTPATLQVQYAPEVLEHPVDVVVDSGGTATFKAAAAGTPTPTVQWQVSTNDGITYNDIDGATGPTLELTDVRFADSGTYYRAAFTNAVGTTYTGPYGARLGVRVLHPTITTDITDQQVAAGSTVTFTAAATGDPTPTPQWQVSTDDGATFTNIAGATSDTYTFTATAADDGFQYRARYGSDAGGSVATSPATLAVTVAPVITLSPADQSAPEGTRATFTSRATGQPTPTVQWQVSTDGGTTFTDIGGATDPTLEVLADDTSAGNRYQAVHTNSTGHATTDAATLTVLPLADVVTQPTPQAVGVGARATFRARSDDPTAMIQWQVSTDGGRTFTDLPGQVGDELTFLTTSDQNGNLYRALFTTTGGITATTPVALTLPAVAPIAPVAPGTPAPVTAVTPDTATATATPVTPSARGAALAVTGADSGPLALAAALLLAAGITAVTIRRRRHTAS